MTTEPKLTPEQVQRLWEIGGYAKPEFEAELQRMGLIAEPVDPLDAVWEVYGRIPGSAAHCTPREKTKAFRDALREVGMELRPQITRAGLRKAFLDADMINLVGNEEIDRLHAALTDGGRDG